MKFNTTLVALFSAILASVSAEVDPICESAGSLPITRYVAGNPDATQCEQSTGFCAEDGGYYECKDNKYVKGSCQCPGRVCRKKAMFIECEKVTPVDPVCESAGSLPITRYTEGKPDATQCVEGTGFCAEDGGYYECKSNKYVKDFCKCPNRFCTKKAMFIECERKTPVTPPVQTVDPVTPPVETPNPVCESAGSLPITRYVAGNPDATQCEQSTGFCAEDGGYYECKDNKYVKGSCQCPGRVCRKKAMFIECEKVTPVQEEPKKKCKKQY